MPSDKHNHLHWLMPLGAMTLTMAFISHLWPVTVEWVNMEQL